MTDLFEFKSYAGDDAMKLLVKDESNMDKWGHATITVSMDGWGPPYRLPFQLLSGSVTLSQRSPFAMWFQADESAWKEGVHYENFDYDLSNFILKAREAVHRPRKKLQEMAERAQLAVSKKLEVFAQLGSIAWSLARIKELSKWEVQAPKEGTPWRIVKLRKGDWCSSKGVPQSVRDEVASHFRSNFDS